MRRLRLPLAYAFAGLALACSGAVTDPLDEGWRANPAPILGTWHLALPEGEVDRTHQLILEIAGPGILSGQLAFPLFGQEHVLVFPGAVGWDGVAFLFDHPETFGLNLQGEPLEWRVRYVAPSQQTCFEPELRAAGI